VPRPREFDEREVLDRAMAVFWETGYQAASVTDLTAATGLSKSRLSSPNSRTLTFEAFRAIIQ